MIGYDKYSLNHQMLLHLPFSEGLHSLAHDIAKPHHILTLTGPPTWNSLVSGFPYLHFTGGAQYLECPGADSADLNFVAEDFTLLAWVWNAGAAGAEVIIAQGETDVSGWELFLFNLNLAFRTNQAGAHTEIAGVGAFTLSAWQLIGLTRHGTAGQFYVNGKPVTTTLNGGLTNPVSPAGGKRLLIGAHEVGGVLANYWSGEMTLPRVWGKDIGIPAMAEIFSSERHWFNV